jgi:acyl-coenzyme A synthetase/AMP-(fatty) acid ligase
MPQPDRRRFLELTLKAGTVGRSLSDDTHRMDVGVLQSRYFLEAPLDNFASKTVFIACDKQLPAVLSALALDGIAHRIVLGLPDTAPAYLPSILSLAGVNIIVSDDCSARSSAGAPIVRCAIGSHALGPRPQARPYDTEWILLTSGTTGLPKLVVHSLASLVGPLDDMVIARDAVWSTFYDVRRYGGLQVLLRALVGGGSMVLSSAFEETGHFLERAGGSGVTHISGTPSHWRKALMSGKTSMISPRYVRLSGEVADQAVLDHLQATYPKAEVAHAFASTEAGVVFDVRDGLAGFPASYFEQPRLNVEMRVVDDTLRVRSSRTAKGYLGTKSGIRDEDGFVDTGDLLQRAGDRYFFVGRREGVINVGGQKVFPEEVEAVINRHPAVRLSRVVSRRSPITGALVAAEVVAVVPEPQAMASLRDSILRHCRNELQPHKVPVSLRFVPALEVSASGKLKRRNA